MDSPFAAQHRHKTIISYQDKEAAGHKNLLRTESLCFQNQQFTSKHTFPTSTGEQLFTTARDASSTSFRSIPGGWK